MVAPFHFSFFHCGKKRSEEHTSELQSRRDLVCRLLLEKKKNRKGTVGGNWGLFGADHRTLKYPPGIAISNYPLWKPLIGSGMILAISVFAVAWLSQRRKPWKPRASSWIAVGISATIAGILLGVAIDKMTYESFGAWGWLRWGSLLVAATATPVL